MSSWLSLSLPNPFQSPADDDDEAHPTPSTAGVKQDLSILSESLTRQFRGVASFLAPPPHSSQHSTSPSPSSSSSETTLTGGIKKDLLEIGGTFKTSLSLLSSNSALSEISKFASNFLHFQNQENLGENNYDDDDDDDDYEDENEEYDEAVGITDEVIDFVRAICSRPELWTDFPLPINHDFVMSEVQKDHALRIEHLVPSLRDLRHKIDSYLSNEEFWIIYFILLLPRLNEDDSELLSTPEIVEVREALLQKLKSKQSTSVEVSVEPKNRSSVEQEVSTVEKCLSPSIKLPAENVDTPERVLARDGENPELWLEEDVNTCTPGETSKQPENEDEISFSDLEDDDSDPRGRISEVSQAQSNRDSSAEQSNKAPSVSVSKQGVQLDEDSGTLGGLHKSGKPTSREKDSEGEDSNDWLTVDGTDFED